MGVINFGIPKKNALMFKDLMGLNVFVEGGTFLGKTAKEMSKHFKQVITIEKSDYMFEKASESLSEISNINLLKGDTREYLEVILNQNEDILFWLDAHWSGGQTYGEKDECPLIEELEIIFKYDINYTILIDDARLFLAPPPAPHQTTNWPSIKQIVELIPANKSIIIFEDVIYIFDSKFDLKVNDYIQILTTNKWLSRKAKNSKLITKIVRKFKII